MRCLLLSLIFELKTKPNIVLKMCFLGLIIKTNLFEFQSNVLSCFSANHNLSYNIKFDSNLI